MAEKQHEFKNHDFRLMNMLLERTSTFEWEVNQISEIEINLSTHNFVVIVIFVK